MNLWRPKDWKVPELIPWGDCRCSKVLGEDDKNLFEMGADAILRALFDLESNPEVRFLTFIKRTGGYIDVVAVPREPIPS